MENEGMMRMLVIYFPWKLDVELRESHVRNCSNITEEIFEKLTIIVK